MEKVELRIEFIVKLASGVLDGMVGDEKVCSGT